MSHILFLPIGSSRGFNNTAKLLNVRMVISLFPTDGNHVHRRTFRKNGCLVKDHHAPFDMTSVRHDITSLITWISISYPEPATDLRKHST